MGTWNRARQLTFVGLVAVVAALGVALCLLIIGGSQLMSVQSGSMNPSIQKGDLVSVKRTPTRDLRVGDVITYTSEIGGGQTITHRIVALTGDMAGRIVTQGDANNAPDKAIYPAQVVGRVEHHVPYAGYLVDFIKQPVGLALVIYLPTLIIVGQEIRKLAKYYKQTQIYKADTQLKA